MLLITLPAPMCAQPNSSLFTINEAYKLYQLYKSTKVIYFHLIIILAAAIISISNENLARVGK